MCRQRSSYPQSGGSVFLSPVGFNKKKNQAIVYMGSICGGLCSASGSICSNKGQWKEESGLGCLTAT